MECFVFHYYSIKKRKCCFKNIYFDTFLQVWSVYLFRATCLRIVKILHCLSWQPATEEFQQDRLVFILPLVRINVSKFFRITFPKACELYVCLKWWMKFVELEFLRIWCKSFRMSVEISLVKPRKKTFSLVHATIWK